MKLFIVYLVYIKYIYTMQTITQTIQAVKITFTQNEKGLWAYQLADRPQSKFKMTSLSQAKNMAEKATELYWMCQNKND